MASRLVKLRRGEFIGLARECGLEIRPEDIEQMSRRGLICPLGTEESPRLTPLHLYVVARYLEAVRPIRHPWGTETPETTLDDVSALAREVETLLEAATGRAESTPTETFVTQRFDEIEAFLGRIDPYGPLGEVLELLKPEVVAETANAGRLYLEIRRAKRRLQQRLRAEPDRADRDEEQTRRTRELYDLEPGDGGAGHSGEGPEAETDTEEAIEEVVSAAEDDDQQNGEGQGPPPPTEDIEVPGTDESDGRPMKSIQVTLEPDQDEQLEEESSEPIVLVEDDSGDVHVEQRDDEETDGSGPSVPPPSPAERREKFEQKRRELADDQRWEALVTLFDEHLEAVQDRGRRQKLLVELARIAEVKLRDRNRAFEAFSRAWELSEVGDDERERAFDGLQRLGKSSGFHDRFLQWLRDQLSEPADEGERAQLHKELARGLFADQQFDEAFESFASFLREAPVDHINRDMLNQLDRLGDQVEPERVDEFYADLQARELDEETSRLVEEFVEGER